MSHQSQFGVIVAILVAGLPLSITYIVAMVMAITAKPRIGAAAIFAAVAFALLIGSSCFAGLFMAVVGTLSANGTPDASTLTGWMIVEKLICGFLQVCAYGLLIFAFIKRNRDEEKQQQAQSNVVPQN